MSFDLGLVYNQDNIKYLTLYEKSLYNRISNDKFDAISVVLNEKVINQGGFDALNIENNRLLVRIYTRLNENIDKIKKLNHNDEKTMLAFLAQSKLSLIDKKPKRLEDINK